jgi:collagenase-like PrtC family protease
MKFSIGYQFPSENDSIKEIIEDFGGSISELYFSWPGEPSGRTPYLNLTNEDWEIFFSELTYAKEKGIELVLLFNGSCYGKEAISVSFKRKINNIVGNINTKLGLSCVTTTSPFVAQVIKDDFENIKTRASVNMRIGTVQGMDYVKDFFDGFYLQREYNRNLEHIKKIKSWCDNNKKELHLLANSGCMYSCSYQSFHDNFVSHEAEILKEDNCDFPHSYCWEYLRNKDNWAYVLGNTWIRPEEVSLYEKYFDTIKLATRTHDNPRRVISAYKRGSFSGNLLDLTEPSFSSVFKGYIMDNTKFPQDWQEKVSTCHHDCDMCGYCKKVLSMVLKPLSEYEVPYSDCNAINIEKLEENL